MASSNIVQIYPANTTTPKSYTLGLSKVYLHNGSRRPTMPETGLVEDFTAANHWTLRDGPDSSSNIIARAQGTNIRDGNWHNSFSLVFEMDRFKGSTLVVMGVGVSEGQWAIVGGTGYFTMAQGYVTKKSYKEVEASWKVIEVDIYATFRSTEVQLLEPYREGGAQRGATAFEPQQVPWRLERVKLNHGDCIVSFEYTYIDKDGVRRTEGPRGGTRVWKFDEINFGPMEYVKEITGTIGQSEGFTVVTSLKFITNLKTYGPYGTEKGRTPFSLPEKKNGTIVGFFGRTGGLVDALGVFVRP